MLKILAYLMSILFLILLITSQTTNALKNFGPFDVNVTTELCKGPMRKNISSIQAVSYDDKGICIFEGNFTTFLSGGPLIIKRHLYKWKVNRYEQALPPAVHKTCDDERFEFPMTNVRAENSICYTIKGTISFRLDMNKLVRKHLQDSFFYGKYKAVMVYYIKEGNFLCLTIYLDVTPIKPTAR